ncbi:hypothetical protein AYL99_03427 [Fonsecaea erecta]|uniref:FAD-binding FR-type domain-containing protein n=1 Tax=Fonsecaea erecta TaxID=1367422 RepID=A0A178ZPC0_9EURO|nr:hypothetical protein AYL99_03427 [Fonsecaea erecta]OAP61226.1 hypothetical protein AYL99_03427 [Fonsecaea erecta]
MAYSMALTLTASELEERRHQLNRAGFHAWLSPIVLMVATYLYRRCFRPALFPSKSPSSPSPVQLSLRRAAWILQTTYIPEFGPLWIQLLGLMYAAWLLYLTFRNTGDDYMHLTKAFGHVAISQLPVHYLLALKDTTYSPFRWATSLTHERLNPVHRLFGRIVHGFLAAHAVLYLRFFVTMGLLPKRIKDPDVRCGILAFWMFNFLGLLSIPAVRRRMYHVLFYRSHVLLSGFVIPVLWAHVPYTRLYVAQVAAIWALGGWARRSTRRTTTVQALRPENIPGTELVRVTFVVNRASALGRPTPGQHVYVRRVGGMVGPKTPFSIADVQSSVRRGEGQLMEVLVVLSNTGGPGTSFFASLSMPALKEEAAAMTTHEIQLEGPYGEASVYLAPILRSGLDTPVLLVAGGVGATYVLPIYTALLKARRRPHADGDARGRRGGRIKMVWLVKTHADAQWGIDLLASRLAEGEAEGLPEPDVDVYITTVSSSSSTAGRDDSVVASRVSMRKKKEDIIHVHPLGHRPSLGSIVDEVLNSSSSPPPDRDDEATVFVCGPRTLSRDLRALVGRRVLSEGRKVRWFEEVFGFGGS